MAVRKGKALEKDKEEYEVKIKELTSSLQVTDQAMACSVIILQHHSSPDQYFAHDVTGYQSEESGLSNKVGELEAELATAQAECTRTKQLLEKVMIKGKQLQQEKVQVLPTKCLFRKPHAFH